jgi:hypothetical protein
MVILVVCFEVFAQQRVYMPHYTDDGDEDNDDNGADDDSSNDDY